MLNKSKLLLVLFVILGGLYSANIFSVGKFSSLIIEKPAKLSIVVLLPDKNVCEKCFDPNKILKTIKTLNVKVYKLREFKYSDTQSRELIKKYAIKTIPAIIFFGDVNADAVAKIWSTIGGEKKENIIIAQNFLPGYDLSENTVKGAPSVILLGDNSCKKCFDPKKYIDMNKRLGIYSEDYKEYDISSDVGKKIVTKYSIKQIPTFIISRSASDYPWFKNAWKSVGTEEKDGWFVFREVQKIGLGFEKI
jgi:thioredoxin-related protein